MARSGLLVCPTLLMCLMLAMTMPLAASKEASQFFVPGGRMPFLKAFERAGRENARVTSSGAAQVFEIASMTGKINAVAQIEHKADENSASETGLQLHKAILARDSALLASLLAGGADPNHKNKDGDTPLIVAAEKEFLRAVPILLEQGADFRATDSSQRTLLQKLAKLNAFALVTDLIERGADVNAVASGSTTPLMASVCNRGFESALALINSGASISATDYRKWTPLHYACYFRNFPAIYLLVTAKADVNAVDANGNTPLLTLGHDRHGFTSDFICSADYLLQLGADINAVNNDGKSLVDFAEAFYDPAILRFIIERGGRLKIPESVLADNPDNATSSLLLQAVTDGRRALAVCLLESLPPGTKPAVNSEGKTALHVAVESNMEDLVNALLENGFDPNHADNASSTPLHQAVSYGMEQYVPLLLGAGARTDLKNSRGATAIRIAEERGKLSLYRFLSEWKPLQVNTASAALQVAGSSLNLAEAMRDRLWLTVRHMLAEKRGINDRDASGSSPLHYCYDVSRWRLARKLLDAGADPAVADENGKTPLHLAAGEGNCYLARMLLEHGTPVDPADKKGRTPLSYAIEGSHLPVIDFLLSRGADINHADVERKTPVFYIKRDESAALMLEWLALRGADVNVADKYDYTVCHHLAWNSRSPAFFKSMQRAGVDIFKKDRSGRSPFSNIVANGSEENLDYFLQQPAYREVIFSDESLILHDWVAYGRVEMLEKCLKYGASPDLKNPKGEALLFASLEPRNASATAMLIAAGASVKGVACARGTLLEVALKKGLHEQIRMLLAAGADPNQETVSGIPLLWLAAGNWQVCELLVEHGARPEVASLQAEAARSYRRLFLETPEGVAILKKLAERGTDLKPLLLVGDTPEEQQEHVFSMAESNRLPAFELALDTGFPINTTDSDGNTLLHIAALNGRKEIALLLLRRGASLEARNQSGATPLLMSFERHPGAALALLEAGADPQVRLAGIDASALHLASMQDEDTEVLKFLVHHGVSIESRDVVGATPLLWAAHNGAASAAAYLLSCGANPNSATAIASFSLTDPEFVRLKESLYARRSGIFKQVMNGLTPLAAAVIAKSHEVVRRLLDAGADPNLCDALGNTSLHIAALNDMPAIAELLLQAGASPFQRNAEGFNAIELADNGGQLETAFRIWQTIPASITADPTVPVATTSMSLHEAAAAALRTDLRWLIRQNPQKIDSRAGRGCPPVCVALSEGQIVSARILLQMGASATVVCKDGTSPLILAARKSVDEMVLSLASAGASVNHADSLGNTALHFAAAQSDPDMVQLLLDLKAERAVQNHLGRTPLMEAVFAHEDARFRKFIEDKHEEINQKIRRFNEKKKKRAKEVKGFIVKQMLRPELEYVPPRQAVVKLLARPEPALMAVDKHGQTAMHLAARTCDQPIIKVLCEAGCDLEARDRLGRTPLFQAVVADNTKGLQALISMGASANAVDYGGETLLSLTDSLNRSDLRQKLLDAGVASSQIVPQWPDTAAGSRLARAVAENRFEAVKYLAARAEESVNAIDQAGETALFTAVRNASPEMIELLLQLGAEPGVANPSGMTPLDIARQMKCPNDLRLPRGVPGLFPDTASSDMQTRSKIINLLEKALAGDQEKKE
ncbi:hypothetical protein MASR1M12_37560 [Erysipelotrichia bacterium]